MLRVGGHLVPGAGEHLGESLELDALLEERCDAGGARHLVGPGVVAVEVVRRSRP
ncbi:hypothetical protein ACQPYK_23715 [Streptosporangium sp. CA-135522]|uniref:hypothetical protein n=1 Tax=Streptosporangium sp. CA-135522 TaxID=3240072 RepID=UPI003D8E86F6